MSRDKRVLLLRVSNVVAFLFTVAVNALDGISPINGKTTGEISDLYPSLFTPAGYVFSIWGLIYTLLMIFVVFQALPSQQKEGFLTKISYFFVLSNVANVLWLLLWHYELIAASTVPIFVLLGALIAIYLRLDIGRSTAPLKEKLAVHLPFSVYLGWITVASIGNVAVALNAANWDGWGISDVTWTILVLIVATIITLMVVAKRRDAAYSLVIIWALVGIIVKQMDIMSIVLTSAVSAAIILIALVTSFLLTRSKRAPT